MPMRKLWMVALVAACGLLRAPGAQAQWAVIDVHAIGQLVQQVSLMQQDLDTARSQLDQAQAQFQALTGTRGMQGLLSGTVRNYLPGSNQELDAVLQGGGAYPGLAGLFQSARQSNAVLTPAQVALLSPSDQQRLQEQRATVALLQGLSGTALANASGRFPSLQQLIDAIGGATDPKAALDLQARIGAEQGMLQNEQTKQQVLYQAAEARHWADAQRAREQVVAGHGDFTTRFEPHP